jgi:hypothetical protein
MKTISTKIFESQDVVDLHNKFLNDKKFWLYYLSWGKKTTVSIGKFYNKNKNLFDWKMVSDKNQTLDIDKLSKWSIETSHKYAEFVKKSLPKLYNKKNWNEEIEMKIANWFQGAVGEYFFIEIMPKDNILMNVDESNVKKFSLSNVTPYAVTSNDDYGIDFIAVNNDNEPVAGQIKFWFSHSTKIINWGDVFGKLVAEAQGDEIRITDPTKDNNLIVMWLGDEISNVSISLKKQKNYHQLSVIGANTIKMTNKDRKDLVNIWNQKWANLK